MRTPRACIPRLSSNYPRRTQVTLLCFAARRDHIQSKIAPALAAGKVVICDHFTDSTYAYQGGGRGFDLATLNALEATAQGGDMLAAAGCAPEKGARGGLLQPDLTLLFYLDPAIAAERLTGARAPDKFERQPVDFFHAVNNGYMSRVRREPERFALVQASLPRERVWENVHSILRAWLWLRAQERRTPAAAEAMGAGQ